MKAWTHQHALRSRVAPTKGSVEGVLAVRCDAEIGGARVPIAQCHRGQRPIEDRVSRGVSRSPSTSSGCGCTSAAMTAWSQRLTLDASG